MHNWANSVSTDLHTKQPLLGRQQHALWMSALHTAGSNLQVAASNLRLKSLTL
jgi:hypothetical protein